MSDPNEPYPIEPTPGEAPAPPAAARPSDAEEDAAPSTPAPSGRPKPRLLADRLLDDFEEDADFTADPELDKALGRKPDPVIPPEAGPQAPEFVVAGLGSPKVWAAF